MNLLLLTSLALVFFFGLLTIALSLIEERTRKAMRTQTALQRQKILQISILKEIQDRIGYSLDTQEVIDVITGSLKNIFPYCTASSMVIKEDKIVFKVSVEEVVSRNFLESVKNSMLASLKALLPIVPKQVDALISGVALDDSNISPFSSFFHIPLVVNNQVVGIINLSSTKPNLYKEDEMTILYQITAQASNALTRLKQVLEVEKGKLTSLISSLADGVFMMDNAKSILIINESAKRFLGLTSQNPSFFDIVKAFPKEYDIIANIEKASLNKLPTNAVEVSLGEKVFQTFITPVVSGENTIGISFLLHDITLEKNLSRIKEDFTNMMVHELRAPLSAVKDSSELMIENEKLTDNDKNELLSIINSQSKILLEQITDLLDAAKIEGGKLTISKKADDLGIVVSQTVKTFLPMAEKKGITLNSKVSPLPPALFDKTKITQVLNNLISNSLKFTPEGGKIMVEVHPVRENSSNGTGFAKVSVSDTGTGIPVDKQRDLFSKFYQVQNPQHPGGTGLGLYIVKGIVEAHNGKVGLVSEKDKGTTITFTLPISQPLPQPSYKTLN